MNPSGASTTTARSGISLPTCVALVTSTMVGTGVYTSLGFQLQDLRSGFSILILWGLGGLISLCGALSYAELSARIPRSGGEYTYLSEIYHPALGFMAACVSLLAGFAAPIALSAMAFGSYLHAAVPECPERLSGLLAVVLITLLHLRSLETSSLVQNVTTILKFLLVAIFVGIGLRFATLHPQTMRTLLPAAGSLQDLLRPASGVALLFVLYAYSGWNAATYLSGEVREGRRIVGFSLILGTLVVTVLYLVLNSVFLSAAPASELKGVLNVGSVAANHLIGTIGGAVMSGVIALGLLASTSAMVFAGPRVTQRVSEDHAFFRFLASTNPRGIPRRGTILQLILVIGLIASASFESVLVYAQVPLLLCLILGVVGVMVLRVKSTRSGASAVEDSAFRCPLYPLPPVVFILSTLAGLIYSAINKPWVALAGVVTMVLPLALYPLIVRKISRS
jgi:APA family basic amino acid/polyamine antiporter